MQFFNSGLFWFLEGIIFCIVIIGFNIWMTDKGIKMTVWKWLAFFVWVLLFGFTIAFVGTSIGENEVTAAIKGGILFGVVTILSGVALWKLLTIHPGSET